MKYVYKEGTLRKNKACQLDVVQNNDSWQHQARHVSFLRLYSFEVASKHTKKKRKTGMFISEGSAGFVGVGNL